MNQREGQKPNVRAPWSYAARSAAGRVAALVGTGRRVIPGWIESAIALGLFTLPLVAVGAAGVGGALHGAGGAVFAGVRLLPEDGWPTLRIALRLAGVAVLYGLAFARFLRASPHRLIWAPFFALVTVLIWPLIAVTCSSPFWFMTFAAVSIVAALMAPSRAGIIAALLPAAFGVSVVLVRHWLPLYWTTPRLIERCAGNDGVRPAQVPVSSMTLDNYSTNMIDEHTLFMASNHSDHPASLWLHRDDDGTLTVTGPSKLTGNFWNGCHLDGALWVSRNDYLVAVRPPDEGQVFNVQASSPERHPIELISIACDPERRAVFAADIVGGRLWEMATSDPSKIAVHELGGEYMHLTRRTDGRIVAASTTELIVYDPVARQIESRQAAGMLNLAIDRCQSTDEVAVGDLTGRVRFFSPAGAGYAFDWGVDVPATRFLAYAPDCAHVVATSSDDSTVSVIDTAARRVSRVFRGGPGLREVRFIGSREFVWTDACTTSTVHL